MSHPNPTWLKGKRGRTKITTRWYIKLDDRFGVMADPYNIILAETIMSNGKPVPAGRAFTSTFGYMSDIMVPRGVPQKVADAFRERTKNFKTKFKDGKLVITIPDGFEMDESPFQESTV